MADDASLLTGGPVVGSRLTSVEREHYLYRTDAVDALAGYPYGMAPAWMRALQAGMGPGWPDTRPGIFIDLILRWFRGWLDTPGITLMPSCTDAFDVAADAVTAPGDRVLVLPASYDSWPERLRRAGRTVAWVPRSPDGQPDPERIDRAIAPGVAAVLLVSPDNPLGTVAGEDTLAAVADVCARRNVALIVDHCLATVAQEAVPLLPAAVPERLRWVALADTGKLVHLGHAKLGALAYPGSLAGRIGLAASSHSFAYAQYTLALLAMILSDPRLPGYQDDLAARVAANHGYLRDKLAAGGLEVAPLAGGPFAIASAPGDGSEVAARLRRTGVLVTPVAWFPPAGPDPRIRLSLARPPGVIERLAAALLAAV